MHREHKRRCNLRLLFYALVAALIGTCSSPPPLLDQVLEIGELRVVTRDSPTTYFEGPDGPAGPEFDLVRGLAADLGVKLAIKSVDSISEILPHLLSGKSHMAAAGLSITKSRREYLNFSHPYDAVNMHLIYKLGTGKPRSIEQVIGRVLWGLECGRWRSFLAPCLISNQARSTTPAPLQFFVVESYT